MKPAPRPHRAKRGLAAIELSLILTLLVMIVLPILLTCARVFWHFNVIHKASYSAAQYLAVLPNGDIRSPAGMSAGEAGARALIAGAAAGAQLDWARLAPLVWFTCHKGNTTMGCGSGALPDRIEVTIQIQLDNSRMPSVVRAALPHGLTLYTSTTLPYANRD